MVQTRIVTTAANLDDDAEMLDFLAPIPNGALLAKLLQERQPTSTRAYEDETQTARFIESDGRRVMCFAVAGITIDQAEMIEARREELSSVDADSFRLAVDRALVAL